MKKVIIILGLLLGFISVKSQTINLDSLMYAEIEAEYRAILEYANQTPLQSKNDECEMYNRALMWIDGVQYGGGVRGTRNNYFSIDKIQEKIKKNSFKISFENNVFNWKDLEYLPIKNDSLNCVFEHIKYEFCNTEQARLVYYGLVEKTIIIDSTEYYNMGIVFSEILYKKEQYAMFRVFVNFGHPNIHYFFLFEKIDGQWNIKEVR